MAEPARTDGRRLFAAAAAVYLLLGQRTLHGDALALLARPPQPGRALYAGLHDALAAAVGWLGIGRCGAGLLLSALAAALGVCALHSAARRLGDGRGAAALAAALAGGCPAVLFFATTVQVPALTFGALGLATLAAARWAARPAWGIAAAAGAVALLPAAVPGPGAFAPLVLLPWQALERARLHPGLGWRAQAAQTALFAAVYAGGVALLGGVGCCGCGSLPGQGEWMSYDLATLLPLCARDWLRAYLPLSIVWFAALWRRDGCAAASWLLLALAVHLVLACHATQTLGDEGSWLLAFAFPAARLALRTTGERRCRWLLAIALLLGAAKTFVHGDRERIAWWVDGVRAEAAAAAPALLHGPRLDAEALFVRSLAVDAVPLLPLLQGGGPAPAVVEACVGDLRARRLRGQRLLLSEEGEALLRDPLARGRLPAAAALLARLRADFVWRAIVRPGCLLYELVER
jgi:hypothetical protein